MAGVRMAGRSRLSVPGAIVRGRRYPLGWPGAVELHFHAQGRSAAEHSTAKVPPDPSNQKGCHYPYARRVVVHACWNQNPRRPVASPGIFVGRMILTPADHNGWPDPARSRRVTALAIKVANHPLKSTVQTSFGWRTGGTRRAMATGPVAAAAGARKPSRCKATPSRCWRQGANCGDARGATWPAISWDPSGKTPPPIVQSFQPLRRPGHVVGGGAHASVRARPHRDRLRLHGATIYKPFDGSPASPSTQLGHRDRAPSLQGLYQTQFLFPGKSARLRHTAAECVSDVAGSKCQRCSRSVPRGGAELSPILFPQFEPTRIFPSAFFNF